MDRLPRTFEEHRWLAVKAALESFGAEAIIVVRPMSGFVLAEVYGVTAAGSNVLDASATAVENILAPSIEA